MLFSVRRAISSSVCLLLGLLIWTAPGYAAPIITVQNVSAAPGGSGAIEVLLSNPGGPPVDIGGFSFQIEVAAGSGVSFTGVSESTVAATYLFGGITSSFGLTELNSLPASIVLAADFGDTATDFRTLGADETYSLGRISFDLSSSVADGTVIPVLLTSVVDAVEVTSLSDPNGAFISYTSANGSITAAVPTQEVPEPVSLTVFAIGLGAGAIGLRRKLRRATLS